VLLERFAREALPRASPVELRLFERLLALPDPLLAGYLLGGNSPDHPGMAELVRRIRDI